MAHHRIDEMVAAYLETALWSSTDNTDDSGGSPLDDNYTTDDLAPETLASAVQDCAAFMWYERENIRAAELSPASVGHNFWLTRNHHGAGFWDLGLGNPGRNLTDAAHVYGSVDLYVGDDGKVYGG